MFAISVMRSRSKSLYAAFTVVAGVWGFKVVVAYLYQLYLRRIVRKLRTKFQDENERMFMQLVENLSKKKLSTEELRKISSLTFAELQDALQQSKLSPSTVLAAFQQKALEAHERTNCLVHPFPEAESQARELDLVGGKRGLLHGIPVSIKDIVPVKDYTFSGGMGMLLAEIAKEDCCIVKVLKSQGAIPFVKTTTPQGSIAWHCVNPNTGTTTNPEDPEYSPGGSSSGDGALLGCGGAPIGIGTDAGGSLRCPAIWSGCCSLKPTANRLSHLGILSNYFSGQQTAWVVTGPMAIEVDGLVACMKALCSPPSYELDTRMPPLLWKDEILQDKRPLRFGYYTDHEDMFPVTPACHNVVMEVKDALIKRGHEVMPWKPVRPQFAVSAVIHAACGDNGKLMADFMAGDNANECSDLYFKYQLGDATSFWTKLRVWLLKLKNTPESELRSHFTSHGAVTGWWDFTAKVETWRCEWSDAMQEAGLDAIICPGSAFPPPKNHKDTYKQCLFAMVHWCVYNILDIPCGALSEMKTGLPIGVQCATYKWQEELCLRAMKEIELAVNQKDL